MSDGSGTPEERIAATSRLVATLRTEIAAEAPRDREDEEKLAAAARRGERGPAWQRIQQRIDLGQTSLDDVFRGEDTSADARSLQDQSRRTLAALGEGMSEAAATDPEALDPAAEAAEILEEMQERIRAVQRLLGTTGGPR